MNATRGPIVKFWLHTVVTVNDDTKKAITRHVNSITIYKVCFR